MTQAGIVTSIPHHRVRLIEKKVKDIRTFFDSLGSKKAVKTASSIKASSHQGLGGAQPKPRRAVIRRRRQNHSSVKNKTSMSGETSVCKQTVASHDNSQEQN